jgi:ABC-type amino acid transport substrate-binding protein
MKKHLALIGLLVIAGAAIGGDLLACGDKFLVVSRGTRFQRPSSRRPASILVYANAASPLPRGLANVAIDATLQKAGYNPTTVANRQELETALAKGGWDLIVADLSDARAVTARLKGEPSTAVLPVVYKPKGNDLKQARDEFQCVLKSPAKNQSFLDAVDEALSLKPARTPAAGKSAS